MGKWKKRYEKLRESSMCKNIWLDLVVDQDTGIVRTVYSHRCDDDCKFLKAIRYE